MLRDYSLTDNLVIKSENAIADLVDATLESFIFNPLEDKLELILLDYMQRKFIEISFNKIDLLEWKKLDNYSSPLMIERIGFQHPEYTEELSWLLSETQVDSNAIMVFWFSDTIFLRLSSETSSVVILSRDEMT